MKSCASVLQSGLHALAALIILSSGGLASPGSPGAPFLIEDCGPCVGDIVVLGWDPVPGAQYYVVLADDLPVSSPINRFYWAQPRGEVAQTITVIAGDSSGQSAPGPGFVIPSSPAPPAVPDGVVIAPNPYPPGTGSLTVSANPVPEADEHHIWLNGERRSIVGPLEATFSPSPGVIRVASVGSCAETHSPAFIVSNKNCQDYGSLSQGEHIIDSVDTPGQAFALTTLDNHVFIADGTAGFSVIDYSEPSALLDLGSTGVPGEVTGIAAAPGLLAVAASESGLHLYDVSDPLNPVWTGTADTDGSAFAVTIVGSLAYVSDIDGGLAIVDISQPTAPLVVGTAPTPGDVWGLTLDGGIAYLAAGYSGLQVADVSNPAAPQLIGSFDTPGDASGAQKLGNWLYLADGQDVLVFDVSVPASPVLINTIATGNQSYALLIHDDFLYVADRDGYTRVLDLLSDPSEPGVVGDLVSPGEPFGLVQDSDLLFLADFSEGLHVCYLQCREREPILLAHPWDDGTRPCGGEGRFDFLFQDGFPSRPVFEYTVRVVGDSVATFTAADFEVFNLPGEGAAEISISENSSADCTLSFKVQDPLSSGISGDWLLFSLAVQGQSGGRAEITVSEAQFFDGLEQEIILGPNSGVAMDFDCVSPDSVANLGQELVGGQLSLSWNDPPDADLGEIHIFRGKYHDQALGSAYPAYGSDAHNSIPADHATYADYLLDPAWEFLTSVPAGTGHYQYSAPDRGCYFHQILALDVVGQPGPPLANSPALLSYVLGDIMLPSDGQVSVGDLNLLGDTYRLASGHPQFNPEADIGPTSTGNNLGCPLPDGVVQFEDLMIFALGFQSVSTTKLAPHSSEGPVALHWKRLDPGSWACTLASPCPSLKGLQVRLLGDGPVMGEFIRGELLNRQASPVVIQKVAGAQPGVDLAVLGAGAGIEGTGELFRFNLGSTQHRLGLQIHVEGRDLANRVLPVDLNQALETSLPQADALGGNFPNPFNPSTSIPFTLARQGMVRLEIYGVDGRLTRTLVEGRRPAGRHSIEWDGKNSEGQNAPSGLFFYRLETGEFKRTRKMVLLR